MTCPKCSHDQHRILDSRYNSGLDRQFSNGIKWRRRHCMSCFHKWSTVELSLDELRFLLSELDNALESAAHARESQRLISLSKNNYATQVSQTISEVEKLLSKFRLPSP